MSGIAVLMYHVIDVPGNDAEAQFCCAPELFRSHLQYLKDAGYAVLKLSDVLHFITSGSTDNRKMVAITFDDGVACSYEKAYPILKEFGYTASMFMISGLVDGFNEWGREYGYPKRRMLSGSELRALQAGGMDIGSHTVSHAKLGATSFEQMKDETLISKKSLEDILGTEVNHFAYPYGSVNKLARQAVMEAGYRAACSTLSGKNDKCDDPFLMRRIDIRGDDSLAKFALKLKYGWSAVPPIADFRRLGREALVNLGLLKARDWQVK